MADDHYENQLLAENIIFQILMRYSQKIVLDPNECDHLQASERDFIRRCWQAEPLEISKTINQDLEDISDDKLSKHFRDLHELTNKAH